MYGSTYTKLSLIEERNIRENRWTKVFEKKPQYATKILAEMNSLARIFSWFSQGTTAAAYHSAKAFCRNNTSWKKFKPVKSLIKNKEILKPVEEIVLQQ